MLTAFSDLFVSAIVLPAVAAVVMIAVVLVAPSGRRSAPQTHAPDVQRPAAA